MRRRTPEAQYLVQGQHRNHTEHLLLLDTMHLHLKHQEDMEHHLLPHHLAVMMHLQPLLLEDTEHPHQLQQEIMEHPLHQLQLGIMEPPLHLPQLEIMEPPLHLLRQEIMEHQLLLLRLEVMEHRLLLLRLEVMEHQLNHHLIIMEHPLPLQLKSMEHQQLITMGDLLTIMTMIIMTLLLKHQTVMRPPSLLQILTWLQMIPSSLLQLKPQISMMLLGQREDTVLLQHKQQVDTVLLPQATKPPEEGGNSTDLRP